MFDSTFYDFFGYNNVLLHRIDLDDLFHNVSTDFLRPSNLSCLLYKDS